MQKTSIMAILLCMAVVSAHGDIASKSYVESVASGVQAKIDTRASNDGYTPERVLQTDASGNVTADLLKTDMISDGAVTNSRMASGLGLDKMDVGELPTSGKHIMIWNAATQKYVFESLADGGSSGLQCPAGQYNIGFSQCVDAGQNGTGTGYNATEWTWWTDFDYGRVSGEATCLSAAEGLGRAGTMGAYYGTGEYSSTFIDTVKGLKDYDANGAERGYCWCKMTHPAVSRWVFNYDFFSASLCASNCAYDCRYRVRDRAALRSGVFGSVGLK